MIQLYRDFFHIHFHYRLLQDIELQDIELVLYSKSLFIYFIYSSMYLFQTHNLCILISLYSLHLSNHKFFSMSMNLFLFCK